MNCRYSKAKVKGKLWRRETGKFEIIRKNEGNLQNFI
jgi:hypothetical protein